MLLLWDSLRLRKETIVVLAFQITLQPFEQNVAGDIGMTQ